MLIDSWSGHSQKNVTSVVPSEKHLQVLTIPKGTTGICQPCDVFFFRQWKNFVRTLSDKIVLEDIEIKLHQRNNLVKIQALAHNQFSSPRFKNMIRFAWYQSGYLPDRPETFETPAEYCFRNTISECFLCDSMAFVICAWCKESICIHHFFVCFHFCKLYNE